MAQQPGQALDLLQRDLAIWRTALAKSATLAMKMAAVGMVEDDVLLISALLRRPDFTDDLLSAALDSVLRPLTKAERSLYWPIRNEFALEVARYEALNADGDLKRKESDSNERWVAALTGLTKDDFDKVEFPVPANWLAKAPAQKQKTLALYAAYSEALMKASEIPNSPFPRLQDLAQASHRSYLDHFVNPIDNMFASTGAEPAWKVFADRLQETDARLRLVSLQARLRRPARETSVPFRIVHAGTAFYDPFSGIPMLWNATTGLLYSVGKDGRDNGGDFTTYIAISIGMPVSAPLQPATETKRKPKR